MNATSRAALIDRYVAGPAMLRSAVARVPREALQWRPGAGKWSVHEIVGHCADAETVAATRIRYLIGEERPVLQAYDQDRWANASDYHALPLELALRQVEQVHAWTAEFLRRLPESAWSRTGTHTETGPYSAERWLGLYAEHLEAHARQVERNLAAWNSRAVGAR
jgi:hypothetical protein